MIGLSWFTHANRAPEQAESPFNPEMERLCTLIGKTTQLDPHGKPGPQLPFS